MRKLYAVKVWRTSEPRNYETIWVRTSTATPRARPGDRKLSRLQCTRARRVRRWNVALCRARRVSRSEFAVTFPELEPWLTDMLAIKIKGRLVLLKRRPRWRTAAPSEGRLIANLRRPFLRHPGARAPS